MSRYSAVWLRHSFCLFDGQVEVAKNGVLGERLFSLNFFFLFLTFVQMQKLRCGDFVEFSFLNFMLSLLIVKFSL